jgi:hypothetical protein
LCVCRVQIFSSCDQKEVWIGGGQCGKQIPSQLYIQNIVYLKAKTLEEDQLDSSNIFDLSLL